MPGDTSAEINIVWRGDRNARQMATRENNRFQRIFEELARLGIRATPSVYDEAFADELQAQLLGAEGVLVWVDSLDKCRTRAALDLLLCKTASNSFHPGPCDHPAFALENPGCCLVLFMDMIAEIRRRHLISKESISAIARDLKLSRPTVRKHCRTQCEPIYHRSKQPTPMLGEFEETLEAWLRTERCCPSAAPRVGCSRACRPRATAAPTTACSAGRRPNPARPLT